MGIFDFVRGAGKKLGGGAAKEEAAFDEQLAERQKGNSLMRHVMGLGFEVEGLRVDYDDGVATIKGKVADQATKERVVLAVGNTEGVAQVDDQLEVEVPAPTATLYTVVSGDTLGKIAKAHYGDAMKYPAIFEANQPLLENPDRIYPGQVLRLPVLDA